MMTTWQATSLSVQPPSREVADTDRIALTFTAGEAITAATATIALLPGGTPAAGIIESTVADTVANTATVIVSAMITGQTYRLDVAFTRPDATRWTKTLTLICVA